MVTGTTDAGLHKSRDVTRFPSRASKICVAEAAARPWYNIPAARVNREQAARLAAVIPSPLRRRPERMNSYSAEILHLMSQTGW
jgi:membrane peptidoglycan carboxypeptidase